MEASYIQAQKHDAVLLARFHDRRPTPKFRVYCTYAGIAKALRMPYHRVRTICANAIKNK